MANEYNVIGEHKSDERHLLVVGDDGQFYDYSLASESLHPTDPDENWQVDDPVASEDVDLGIDTPGEANLD